MQAAGDDPVGARDRARGRRRARAASSSRCDCGRLLCQVVALGLVQQDDDAGARRQLAYPGDLERHGRGEEPRRHGVSLGGAEERKQQLRAVHVLLVERPAEGVQPGDHDDGRGRGRQLGLGLSERLERQPAAAVGLDEDRAGDSVTPEGVDLGRRQALDLLVLGVGSRERHDAGAAQRLAGAGGQGSLVLVSPRAGDPGTTAAGRTWRWWSSRGCRRPPPRTPSRAAAARSSCRRRRRTRPAAVRSCRGRRSAWSGRRDSPLLRCSLLGRDPAGGAVRRGPRRRLAPSRRRDEDGSVPHNGNTC